MTEAELEAMTLAELEAALAFAKQYGLPYQAVEAIEHELERYRYLEADLLRADSA